MQRLRLNTKMRRVRRLRISANRLLLIEDIPAGEYTLLFRHEDRNTLTKAITIKAVETLKLGKIQLPDIDMSLFQQASVAESAGKFSEANGLYSQFYTKYPKHRMASYAMYREGYVTQLRLRQVADGRKILENVIARKPDAEILAAKPTSVWRWATRPKAMQKSRTRSFAC